MINFYDLVKCVHIKTVAVVDELEGLVALSLQHSNWILGVDRNGGINDDSLHSGDKKGKNIVHSTSAHKNNSDGENGRLEVFVMAAAGNRGLLRLFRVDMRVT